MGDTPKDLFESLIIRVLEIGPADPVEIFEKGRTRYWETFERARSLTEALGNKPFATALGCLESLEKHGKIKKVTLNRKGARTTGYQLAEEVDSSTERAGPVMGTPVQDIKWPKQESKDESSGSLKFSIELDEASANILRSRAKKVGMPTKKYGEKLLIEIIKRLPAT